MSTLHAEYAGKRIRILAVNAFEPVDQARGFIEASSHPYEWMFAEKSATDALGIKAVPTQILIDPDGKVVWTSSLGSISQGVAGVRAALDTALR